MIYDLFLVWSEIHWVGVWGIGGVWLVGWFQFCFVVVAVGFLR